ncbi:MAG: cation-translocating P-type ATPase, partial [Clostridia bacterium]|nr:cation-translocating P-type ATPase [Clostridia bacterium]
VDGFSETEDIGTDNSEAVKKLLMLGALCCDGSVVFDGEEEKHIGDPTETAIVLAAHKNGMPKDKLNEKFLRLAEIPFDSDRKLMSTVNLIEGRKIVIVKGAFDMMAERCIKGNLEAAKSFTEDMSKDALRVLAIGYKEIDEVPENPTSEALENGLNFMGLVGMIDPPRPEAKDAVALCRRAGIKPVMITGDHVVTASAIAKELGILSKGDKAITGSELDAMTDRELDEQVENISVYARVSPENKIRIVKAWQRKDKVVSMTGDGVNDAPALKAADIGCAMGITGTDVAKGASDMTLTDDNFATIVDAVREGRGIYENIKKVVGFLLGTNIGEVITVFMAMLLWHKTPLLSMQLLWINLVTDSLPAIALGMEAVESDVMDKAPKPKNEGIFAHGLGIRVVLQGIMFAVLTLFGFKMGENMTGTLEGGQTMAFMILALSQVVQSFNMRSEHSLFKIGMFSNKKLNGAAMVSALLVALVLFTPLRVAFGLVILPFKLYLIAVGLIFVPLLVIEITKALRSIKK